MEQSWIWSKRTCFGKKSTILWLWCLSYTLIFFTEDADYLKQSALVFKLTPMVLRLSWSWISCVCVLFCFVLWYNNSSTVVDLLLKPWYSLWWWMGWYWKKGLVLERLGSLGTAGICTGDAAEYSIWRKKHWESNWACFWRKSKLGRLSRTG